MMADPRDRPEAVYARLARLLMDLHRCEHGRHEGDSCFSCEDGTSNGNLLLPPGTVIGHTLYGHVIVVPPWEDHNDPEKWVRER